ncbi:MAG: TMEM175 family protein [Ignavibacteriaceae bacterium]
MKKERLVAFSDGVLAIIITIMVLELKIPHGDQLSDLQSLIPIFLSYALSFTNIGLYWNNHHHLLYTVKRINGTILWNNLHLLFWLSLIPFVTGWMGENHFAMWPVALYGFVFIMAAAAWSILSAAIIKHNGKDSKLAKAYGKDWKGKISLIIYVVAILLTFVNRWIGFSLYIVVVLMWFIPDRRIEKVLLEFESKGDKV